MGVKTVKQYTTKKESKNKRQRISEMEETASHPQKKTTFNLSSFWQQYHEKSRLTENVYLLVNATEHNLDKKFAAR